MTRVFADTAYYIALLDAADEFHQRAVCELMDGFCAASQRYAVGEFVRQQKNDRDVKVVTPTEELFEEGFELFTRRRDKDWSLTDCISFVVMRRHRIADALTMDHHFSQAGFRVLLK